MITREDLIREGKDALEPMYRELKPQFLKYMMRYSKELEIRIDAFHEAMIAFYEYCIKGKYDPQKSSPKTLIFNMGKAYIINRLRKEKKIVLGKSEDILPEFEQRIKDQMNFSLNENEIEIQNALAQLGEKCKTLLKLFYYSNYSIDAIMHRLNYKNENVVSSHKSRCIKKLKEVIKKNK